MRTPRLLVFLSFLALTTNAQQLTREPRNAAANDGTQLGSSPRKELGTEERQAAASIMKVTEAEARALAPDLQSYALAQIARGYSRIKPSLVPSILADAFAATSAIRPDDKLSKQALQSDILLQLLPVDPAKVIELLPQAEEQPRNEVKRQLIRQDISDKRLEEAAELIDQISGVSEYPYEEGSDLMAAFPKEQSWRRGVVFSQAFASYAGHSHGKHRESGFEELILNNWQDLPAGQVKEAIYEVFRQAKQIDETSNTSLYSNTSEPNFRSNYQFQLFQFLPILQEIDKSKAEEILRDQPTVGSLLSKYPHGQGALSPISITTASEGQLPPVNTARYWQSRVETIVASAEQDPKQALAQAGTLPIRTKFLVTFIPIRAEALRGIAGLLLKSNPSAAKDAVKGMVEATPDLQPQVQVLELVEAARLYLKLEEGDDAKKTLELAIPKANDVIKQDENSDDPNLAFKAYWPSAAGWQSILSTAASISPAFAQEMTRQISDDAIRVLAKIALANEMAGAHSGKIIIRESHGRNTLMFYPTLYMPNRSYQDEER